MNEVSLVKKVTEKQFKQDNFLYNIFSSVREKLNAPTKSKKK